MKEKNTLYNEDGSVLIISLVILALLLVIGMSATTTSNIENLVTRNVEQYTVALYRAEAAAMEAAQRLNDVTPNPRDTPPPLLNTAVNAVTDANIVDANYWATDVYVRDDGGIADTQLLAESHGVVGGSTLDTEKSNVYGYTAYGRCQLPSGATVIIGVGYRRAF
jgi:Tfp pilus assembly protein PilX